MCCSMLQFGAVWCSVFHCVAVCCSVLPKIVWNCYDEDLDQVEEVGPRVQQCVAVCCSVLQFSVGSWSELSRTIPVGLDQVA